MKKLLLFAAVAGLGLVSASPPPKGPDYGPREMRRHYPPCSRTITDRCIQLNERGVRAQAERDDYARDDHDMMRRDDHMRGERHWRRDRYADDDMRDGPRGPRGDDMRRERREVRLDYAMDDRGGPRGPDGDHRWCREHHAYHGEHNDRIMVERVRVERLPVRPMMMAARTTHVVGCRCAPPRRQVAAAAPRRQVAQRVRRAGERG